MEITVTLWQPRVGRSQKKKYEMQDLNVDKNRSMISQTPYVAFKHIIKIAMIQFHCH